MHKKLKTFMKKSCCARKY